MLTFASLFQDHAVLQRHLPLPVWGTAESNQKVTVSLAGHCVQVTSGPDGRWLLRLPALEAGGPYELKAATSSAEIVVRDIRIGEVWLCSGQSNMAWNLDQTDQVTGADAAADLPGLLTGANAALLGERQEKIDGQWTPCTPASLLNFSAVAGWFGRELHRELNVPIGLICTAWGGSRVQAWISREGLMSDPDGRDAVLKYEREVFLPPSDDHFASFQDWERSQALRDQGNAGLAKGWHATDHDDSAWPEMPLPLRWQQHGHVHSGVLWFRRTVTLPPDWAGRELELHLGAVDKHDDTWVNGERVGGLSWEAGPNSWCAARVYTVPGHLTAASGGRVTIAVRARSHVFDGGLIGPKNQMYLVRAGRPETEAILLAGSWRYALEQNWGVVQPPAILGDGNPNSPYILFDSRVHPLLPYGIAGVIWYQGESNAAEARLYRRLLPLMIRDWRRAWGQGDFPFLQVQLANYQAPATEPGPSDWAELREAQAAALAEPNTGMAVAIDVGDAADIHPRDKRSVGLRLAWWALAEIYGRGGVPSGPLYTHATSEARGRLRIHFRHAAGFKTRDGQAPHHVAIAGPDRKFLWAESDIEGETLLVWHPAILHPVAVRYAWATNPDGCNLVNAAGLPASPFRTDTW